MLGGIYFGLRTAIVRPRISRNSPVSMMRTSIFSFLCKEALKRSRDYSVATAATEFLHPFCDLNSHFLPEDQEENEVVLRMRTGKVVSLYIYRNKTTLQNTY